MATMIDSQRLHIKRTAISLFIIFNCCAIVITDNPSFSGNNKVEQALQLYARWTRVMQRWSLFCPEPRRYLQTYFFKIHFQNGDVKEWRRPMPPKWDFIARHHASHWQKFDTAASHMQNPALWPDIAKYIARKFSAANPPVEIDLYDRLADTPPPKLTGLVWPAASDYRYHDQLVFSYDVTKDLFR